MERKEDGGLMFEILTDNIQTITGTILGIGGTVFGMWKWHNRQVNNAFKEGKQEESCLQRIENKADDAIEGIKQTNAKLDKEIERAAEHHLRLYDKLDSQGKNLTQLMTDLSFLKGKFSNS